MLTSSESTDGPREAACAMLQLLFLLVHSLADQVPANQVFANNQKSHQPVRTRSKRKPSAAASRLPMLKLEENIVNLRIYLSTRSTLQPSAHAQQLAIMILIFMVCFTRCVVPFNAVALCPAQT